MNRRSILKLLAVTPFAGVVSALGCTDDKKKPTSHKLYTDGYEPAFPYLKYVRCDYYNKEIDLGSPTLIGFDKCRFINCTFKRKDNFLPICITGCYFENCGPLFLTHRDDTFNNNSWKDNINIFWPAVPSHEDEARRARGEIA